MRRERVEKQLSCVSNPAASDFSCHIHCTTKPTGLIPRSIFTHKIQLSGNETETQQWLVPVALLPHTVAQHTRHARKRPGMMPPCQRCFLWE